MRNCGTPEGVPLLFCIQYTIFELIFVCDNKSVDTQSSQWYYRIVQK